MSLSSREAGVAFEQQVSIPPTIDPDTGNLKQPANPHAQQFLTDIEEFTQISHAEEFTSILDGTLQSLFDQQDPDVAAAFIKLDPAAMRASFWTGEWADNKAEQYLHAAAPTQAENNEQDLPFTCHH